MAIFYGCQHGEVRTGSSHKQARRLLSAAGCSAKALLADCCSAHYACSDAFVDKIGPWCTQEEIGEVRRVRGGAVLHTGGVLGRHLCAKRASGAYESESESEETVVIGEEPWAHAERNGG